MITIEELLGSLLFEQVGEARERLETMRRSGEILRYHILNEDKAPYIKITLPDLSEMTIGQI